MDLRKTFIGSDKFTNIANVEIKPNKLRTLLALLIGLKVPLSENEELNYDLIKFKLNANIAGKTPNLFLTSLLDYIIDFYTLKDSMTANHLIELLSENYFPPDKVSFKAGASATIHSIKLMIPFFTINQTGINFNMGFPFTNGLNLEITTPPGKECEYTIYTLTREFLGDTPFITIQKRSQKVLSEISLEFRDIEKLIYATTGNITGSENADIYDLDTNEEKMTNIFNKINTISQTSGGSVSAQKFSEIFLGRQSIKLTMNLDTSITADRIFIYRKISNAHLYRITPVPVPQIPPYSISL